MAIFIGLIVQGCAATDLPSFDKTEQLQLQDDETRLWKRTKEEQRRLDNSHYLYQDPVLSEYVNQVAQNLLPSDLATKGLKIEIKISKEFSLRQLGLPDSSLNASLRQ